MYLNNNSYLERGGNGNNSTPKPLQVQTIEGYSKYFQKVSQLQQCDFETSTFLFIGSDEESPNAVKLKRAANNEHSSWCTDCNFLLDILEEFKARVQPNGLLIVVKVGSENDWERPKPMNPFRLDPKLSLITLPTLIKWDTKKMIIKSQLAGDDALDIQNLYNFFNVK